MRHLSSSELLIEAFTTQKLADIEQNLGYPALSNEEFIELLQCGKFDFSIALMSQLRTLNTYLKHSQHIPVHIINYCLFIDFYYEALENKPYFHKHINEALTELKPVLFKALLLEPKFLQSSQHYLRELLDNLYSNYVAWDDSLGMQSKQLYNRLTHLITSLQTLTGNNKNLPELIKKEVETLQKIFDRFKAIEAQTCHTERELLTTHTQLTEDNKPEHANISKSIIKVSETLKKGQLITYKDKNNDIKRCRIGDIYPDLNEFLFVTFTGKKCLRKNYASLGYELTSKNYGLLENNNLFNKIFSKSVERIINRQDNITKKIASNNEEKIQKKHKEAALKKAKKEADELKKQKDNIEIKHALELEKLRKKQENQEREFKEDFLKKHLKEAETLKQRNEELEKKLREESAKNQLSIISDKVRELTIGSWLDMTLEDGHTTECKVAMIYPSSGKIVFVDKIGRKVGEFMPNIVIEKILSGDAKIIKNASSFESSMERVVTSLKR